MASPASPELAPRRVARALRGWLHPPAWDAVPIWALDLETSGLDPKRDLILSVGMVPIREGTIRWGEHWSSLVRPPDLAAVPAEGLPAHQILPADLARAPALAAVVPEVLRRVAEGAVLLHFAPLDLAFLQRACRDLDLRWPRPPVVDSLDLLVRLHRRKETLLEHPTPVRTSLKAARAALGLPPHVAHDALADALATAELFLVLRARLGARTLRELT